MSDETTPRPNGLRINICYSADTSVLRLQKFHNVSDVATILRACGPVQQYCKLSPQNEVDADALKIITAWMARKRLVSDQYLVPRSSLTYFASLHMRTWNSTKTPSACS